VSVVADLELLVAGRVDAVAPLDRTRTVVSDGGVVTALDALGAAEELGRSLPAVHGAAPWGEVWLLSSEEGLATWHAGSWAPSALDELLEPVQRLVAHEEMLWFGTDAGLRRWKAGQVVAVRLDGDELGAFAVGGDVRGDEVVWASRGDELHGIGNAGAVWVDLEAVALVGEVDSVAVDSSRRAWATAGGWLYGRDVDEGWRRYDLGSPAWTVHAVASAPGVWVETEGAWLRVEGDRFEHAEGLPAPSASHRLAVDGAGRLLIADDEGLWRASTTRPLVVVGIEPGATVARATHVTLVPTAPDEVQSMAAELVSGTGDATALSVVDGVVTLDPDGQPAGPYELVASVDYGDRRSEARISLFLGAGFEPTWGDDIEPLYVEDCALCHGGAATTVLESPEDWEARIDDIVFNVREGNMPLGGEPLSDLEVAVIEAWAEAGFPR
jgi:hypothetical protein